VIGYLGKLIKALINRDTYEERSLPPSLKTWLFRFGLNESFRKFPQRLKGDFFFDHSDPFLSFSKLRRNSSAIPDVFQQPCLSKVGGRYGEEAYEYRI
jgi:hypothetical protein